MTGLFSAILSMSLVATMTAAVVVLIRWILRRRAPRWISYGLWAVVLIRLLVPVSIASPISLFSLVPAFQSAESTGQNGHLSRLTFTGQTPAPAVRQSGDGANQAAFTAVQGTLPQQIQKPVPAKTSSGQKPPAANPKGELDWLRLGAVVWLSGAAVLGVFFAFSYTAAALRLRRLRRLPKNEKILQAEKLLPLKREVSVSRSHLFSMPVVFGLLRPRIVLPWEFDWEDAAAQHILLHERVHISRWDNLAKLAAVFAVCVHWFNPCVWLCFRLCCDDMEASCDERVLALLGENSRKDYARSLLSMAGKQGQQISRISFLAFGESSLKKRVGNILKYHKKTLLSAAAALLAVLLVGCSLLTNPSSGPENSRPDQSQGSSRTESGGQNPQKPAEPGIPVKNPQETTLYLYNTSSMALEGAEKVFYFPLPRPGVSEITPSWLQEQLQAQPIGLGSDRLGVESLTQDGRRVTAALVPADSAYLSQVDPYSSVYLNTVATILLQNCEIDEVYFTLDEKPYPEGESGPYIPAELALPNLSQADIEALYGELSLEQMLSRIDQGTDTRISYPSLTNAAGRWDIGSDEKARQILETIYEATFLNNVPESDFDSIGQAPNSFLVNAAYSRSPRISWYQDDVNPNSDEKFSVLTSYVNDYECVPQKIVEETARQLFGDDVQISHQKPIGGYYHEYAMAYTPYHMGGWAPDIFLLDYTEQGDTVEATVAYSRIYGSAKDPMKTLTDMDEETSIRNREQRHRFTLQKTEDGYRITGYHVVDSWRDMAARVPDYYAYPAICGGLAFFDWDGADNLTPDQLYQWFLAGFSPGLNDGQFPVSTVEPYFYAYSGGYQPEDPTILRQSQYYDEELEAYRAAKIDGVIGIYDSDRRYYCEYGQVTYPDENTALAPVKVYGDEAHSRLLADGVIKLKYQEDPSYPWVVDGFTSN